MMVLESVHIVDVNLPCMSGVGIKNNFIYKLNYKQIGFSESLTINILSIAGDKCDNFHYHPHVFVLPEMANFMNHCKFRT